MFCIARSTFRIYSVMAIFNSSIVWGLFVRCTETFWSSCTTRNINMYFKSRVLTSERGLTVCKGTTHKKHHGTCFCAALCVNQGTFTLYLLRTNCRRKLSLTLAPLVDWLTDWLAGSNVSCPSGRRKYVFGAWRRESYSSGLLYPFYWRQGKGQSTAT